MMSARSFAVCILAALTAGCSTSSTAGSGPAALQRDLYSSSTTDAGVAIASLKGPLVIAEDANDKALEAYPLQPGGSNKPQQLTNVGLFGSGGIVANGRVVAGLHQHPSWIVLYDLTTNTGERLPDHNGLPIDIAIGKDASLYVVNYRPSGTNVGYYPPGQSKPEELQCKIQNLSENIAVDDEGDIFLNGYENRSLGVVEIPNGPNGPEPGKCKALDLQPENGYVAGLAIDPKTDALITLENPGLCAGGEEGRMTIYPKPYNANNNTWHDIGVNCAEDMRLNRDSTIVFVGDHDASGVNSFILQHSYPDGRSMGAYHNGQPDGFTTIPNRLPN
jgi:hypothetical protein